MTNFSFNTIDPRQGMPSKVVDINDPEKRGRVKLRRIDQDEANIPDDKLPWTMVHTSGHSQAGGLGVFPHNLMVGGWVNVTVDPDGQTGQMIGAINNDKDEKDYVSQFAQGRTDVRPKEDIQPGDGDLNSKNEVKSVFTDNSHHQQFHEKGFPSKKFKIISHAAEDGASVLDFIKKHDPQNTSGAVQPAVDVMKKLLNNEDPLKAMQGMVGGNLMGTLNQILSKMMQQRSSGSYTQNAQPKVGDPCSIDEYTQGTLQYVNNALTCVANNSANTGV